jgi:predicted dehydrogenase/threonine dehydrogenase-like Zn-dependent dehydrogenase
VRSVGGEVENFQVGDFVACGGTGYANHSEFNLVPKNLCVHIPKNKNGQMISSCFEEAAFANVGAIALQGVRQAQLTLGERICIIGLGLIGQLTVQLCKANGCMVIGADIDQAKIDLAKKMGADEAVHSEKLGHAVEHFTQGMGADAVIITAADRSNQLISLAGEISRLKGRVVVVGFVGMDIPRDIYYERELDLRLTMSSGPGRYDVNYEERGRDYPLPYVRWTEQRNMQAFLELMASGKILVKSLISHRFPFSKAMDAYKMVLSNNEPYLGVIFEYAAQSEHPGIIVTEPSEVSAAGEIALGVIGAGNFATSVLLPRFAKKPEIKMIGVATGRGMTARSVADKFKFTYCTGSKEEILSDKSINTVIVATRHNLHGPLAEQALKAGKNVFVEKPLCLTIKELASVRKIYEQMSDQNKQKIFMVGFNRRFSPFIRRAKSLLEGRSTPVVASYRVNAGFIPKDSWVQDPVEGGGRIIGEICHFVDTLRFLIGAPVKTIQAGCIQTNDASHINRDSVAIILNYHDGSIGTIVYHALGTAQYPKEKLEISADGMVMDLDDYSTLQIYGRKKEKIKSKQDKGFDAEINAFINAIMKGGPAPIPFSELVETTLVTFAIHQTLDTGQIIFLDDFATNLK